MPWKKTVMKRHVLQKSSVTERLARQASKLNRSVIAIIGLLPKSDT